jgi:HK97 family phage major capsid protein
MVLALTGLLACVEVADMTHVAIGLRQRLAIHYSEHVKFQEDQIAIRSTSRWDIGLIHDQAVKLVTGVRA